MHSFTKRLAPSLAATMLISTVAAPSAPTAEFYLAPHGADANPGTRDKPWATLTHARDALRQSGRLGREAVTVYLRGGTYYLPETFVLADRDSGTQEAPVTYASAPGEEAVISGGVRLNLAWKPYRDGIMKAKVPPGSTFDQLFLDGRRQRMARYPNFDPAARFLGGWSPDAFSKQRAARWKAPRGGFIHALHPNLWGSHHYIITGKDANGNVTYEGGWQTNWGRRGPHEKYRFVENIFEELDAPGEWFLDRITATLYFYPPAGADLQSARIEVAGLRRLIEFRGTADRPVKWITFRAITFRHTARTFMETREPLLRSDWRICRGGAIFLDGAEDCSLEDCFLDQVGGNAVFVNGYNRRIAVRRCHIARAGASGVAFVGDPRAVRNPILPGHAMSFKDIDRSPGPRGNDYPADCLVEDSLIHQTGRFEIQTAPIQISMARRIAIRHCSLYDVPRAGINISGGNWGGHLIEFCDVFDTVKESGDHGSFNSWGRDRYWNLKGVDLDAVTLGENRDLPLLDAMETTVIRNNRWRCDHGWDVDLDDGSTNYHIYNNLLLNGGLKLREGFYRIVENNIMVNNSFHPHVWYRNSQDTFRRNIVFAPYYPIRVRRPWGKQCDFNLLHKPGKTEPTPAVGLQAQSGLDRHSLEADALFVDPTKGNYQVKEGSPAIRLGFKNFPMDKFGVQSPRLKAIASQPQLPHSGVSAPATVHATRDRRTAAWLGATVRNVVGLDEVSAGALPGETGILVLDVPPGSRAEKVGLRKGDVILKMGGKNAERLSDLLRLGRTARCGTKLTIFRRQKDFQLELDGPVR